MKIAYVTDDLYPGFGGQAVAAEGHIEALLKLGNEVRVLAGKDSRECRLPEGLQLERVPVITFKTLQMHFALPDLFKLQALLRWADVLHINNPALFGLIAMWLAKVRKIPVILGVHTQEETATVHFQGLTKQLVSKGIRIWFRFFYEQVDVMIAPTPFAARMASSFSSKPSYSISNGLRWHDIPQISVVRRAEVKKAYLGSKTFLLSYVGRLASEKRPEGLLEIMEHLSILRQDVLLVIAGKGPMKAWLEQEIAKRNLSDYTKLAGFLSEQEKFDLLAASDLFIMPSPTELQNIASLEAMSQGCAIIAAKVSSSALAEMVEEEVCGLTYDLNAPEGLAQELNQLLDDKALLESFQKRAFQGAQKHDTFQSAQQLLELYQTCLLSSQT